MDSSKKPPGARPLFRKLALGTAIVCFVLAAILMVLGVADAHLAAISCASLGSIMLVIWITGRLPQR
jgi:hypothetical protein